MASAHTALFAVGLLFVLFCGPPVFSLWLCILRLRRKLQHGHGGKLLVAGLALSAVVLLFNTAVALKTGLTLNSAPQPFGRLQIAAGALSWLCLWLWIVMLCVRPRIHRRRRA